MNTLACVQVTISASRDRIANVRNAIIHHFRKKGHFIVAWFDDSYSIKPGELIWAVLPTRPYSAVRAIGCGSKLCRDISEIRHQRKEYDGVMCS
jgi:hypothetical protein